jgi:lysophospholipase L1-like esterase
MRVKVKFLAAAITAAVIGLAVVNVFGTVEKADAADKDIYRIVALGDSLTVGYEPRMTESSIPYGYADRIYEQALFHGRAELANYGILGLTTPGLNNLLQGASDSRPLQAADLQDFSSLDTRVVKQADSVAARTAEIASSLRDADLVVLTIGGNDFGDLIKSMLSQSIEDARKTLADTFETRMNKYTTDLDKMIRLLHTLAPDAQIVMADQYLPLWDTHDLYPDLKAAVDKLSARLDQATADYMKENIPVKAVHVSAKFVNKETEYTYITLFDGNDIHPKQAGYEAMAEAFAAAVWPEYRKPAPRSTGVPLSVIVNGNELASKPTVLKNTTFLALRDLANAVQADLKWNQKTKTAEFVKNGKQVSITIGAKSMTVDGVKQPVETPAYAGKDSKTYVPLSLITKGLDYQVVYRAKLQTAFINP